MPKKTVSMYIDEKIWEWAKEQAKRCKRGHGNYIEVLLEKEMMKNMTRCEDEKNNS